ncbi:MAG TPA: PfkB family carbohydrate kinase [Thermomicrobiales bacterium]|nr:PfkB family carbohydrate kinase [Thermomicrobiales bacterium]
MTAATGTQSSTNRSIAVFDPSPLLTVTIEAGSDDAPELHLHAGGQGFWVARMIRLLGMHVTLCAPFGDDTGRVLRVLVEAEGVGVRGTAAQGASGWYVHDRRDGQRETIAQADGAALSRHEVDDLYGAALVTGLEAGVLVLTGPARPSIVSDDVYRRLSTDMRSNGSVVVADVSHAVLSSMLEGGVDMLKMSHEDLIEGGFARDEELPSLLEAIDNLQQAGARNVLISRAADPALARVDGRTVEIIVPRLEPMEFRGSGDSMTAALAVALARDLDLDSALRLAAAAGALNVARHGLGTGQPRDIEALSKRIEIRPVS